MRGLPLACVLGAQGGGRTGALVAGPGIQGAAQTWLGARLAADERTQGPASSVAATTHGATRKMTMTMTTTRIPCSLKGFA